MLHSLRNMALVLGGFAVSCLVGAAAVLVLSGAIVW